MLLTTSRILGSSQAYMMSTIALNSTTKNAMKIVSAITGGTSSDWIELAAYWPTPPRLNTDSVTIAPPPMIAPKSRPHSEIIGISELRSTCLSSTCGAARGPSPAPCARSPR